MMWVCSKLYSTHRSCLFIVAVVSNWHAAVVSTKRPHHEASCPCHCRGTNEQGEGRSWFGRSVGPVGRFGIGCVVGETVLTVAYVVANRAR